MNSKKIDDMDSPIYRGALLVQPGHKLEIQSPELQEGALVNVIVYLAGAPQEKRRSLLDYLKENPVPLQSEEYWKERERELQESRESWD